MTKIYHFRGDWTDVSAKKTTTIIRVGQTTKMYWIVVWKCFPTHTTPIGLQRTRPAALQDGVQLMVAVLIAKELLRHSTSPLLQLLRVPSKVCFPAIPRQDALCVLQHGECKRTAQRRGWMTINRKGKKTSFIYFGWRKCVFACVGSTTYPVTYTVQGRPNSCFGLSAASFPFVLFLVWFHLVAVRKVVYRGVALLYAREQHTILGILRVHINARHITGSFPILRRPSSLPC